MATAVKQPATRSKAATKKPTRRKKSAVQPEVIVATPAPLPNVIVLLRQSMSRLLQNPKLFAGITGIYVISSIVLAQALTASVDIAGLRDQFGNRFLGGAAVYTQLLGSTGSAGQAAGVYQLVLFLFVSLAIIWALRQQRSIQGIRIRDAYYKGMYPLIPFILVLIVLCLQLLPMIIGAAVYQQAVVSGAAASGFEILLWGIGALVLGLLSLYWLAASVFGLYIVTLPDMTPLRALRAAKQLVRYRRWAVLRKITFLPFVIGVMSIIILLPIIIVAAPLAQWALVLFGAFTIAAAHAYLYNMYLRLMNE